MSRRRSSEASIEKIELAALRLFSDKGYSNTSLEEVATCAGFTKGAVYYYFKTKEAVLVHLLEVIRARSIERTAETVLASDETAVEKLVRFVTMQTKWGQEFPDDLAVIILSSIQSLNIGAAIKEEVNKYYSVMQNMLEQIFKEGIKSGELPRDFDVQSAVLTNMARHDGNMLLWHRSGRDPVVGRVLAKAAKNSVLRFTNPGA